MSEVNKHVNSFQNVLDLSEQLHAAIYKSIVESEPDVVGNTLSIEDLTDLGFLCREIENFTDEIRKEAKARRSLCDKLLCAHLAKLQLLGDKKAEEPFKGRLATARPYVKMAPTLPKSGTDELVQLLKHLGVSEDLATSGQVTVRFNGMVDHITQLHEDGKPLPPHVRFAWPDYKCTYRMKKGSKKNEDERNEDHG